MARDIVVVIVRNVENSEGLDGVHRIQSLDVMGRTPLTRSPELERCWLRWYSGLRHVNQVQPAR